MSETAASAIIDVLVKAGVRRLYTVPGESFLLLMEEAKRRPELTLVSTRHESGAAFMAESEAKLTGVPAAVAATRAVGGANLTIGVHTARQDSTPMIILLGQVETPYIGMEAFQEVRLDRFYSEITVSAETLHRADRAAETVARAVARATGARPGPALVALPADLLSEPSTLAEIRLPQRPNPRPSHDELDLVARAVSRAARPVMILGEGAENLHQQLVRFAEEYGVGAYSAFRRQDTFPNDDRHYLGHLTLGTSPEILKAINDADLVLALGTRLDEITTQNYTVPALGQDIIQVHEDPDVLGAVFPLRLGITSSIGNFVDGLLSRPTRPERTASWTSEHKAYLRHSEAEGAETGDHQLGHERVIVTAQHLLPDDTIVVNDAGNFSIWVSRYWRFRQSRTQAAPMSGAMGYGVPAAIGAQFAFPKRRVIAFCGDGGFLMTAQEIETASRYRLPILVVVCQNSLYGTIAMHQARSGTALAAVTISEVDLVGLARSLGAEAFLVESHNDLKEALQLAPYQERPRVLVVRTDPDDIAPGTSLASLARHGAAT